MQLDPAAYRAADFQGKDPELIVETMIYCDEVDDFIVDLPKGLWPYDGMIVYNVLADDIERTADPRLDDSLGRVISHGDQVNDYQLEGETIMMSISPETARAIVDGYRVFTGEIVHEDAEVTLQDVRDYINQWLALLTWAADQRLALVMHAG